MEPKIAEIVEPPFSESFAFDIAFGFDDPETVCAKHGVDSETFEALKQSSRFNDTVHSYFKDLKENGLTAKVKAKIAVEDLIPEIHSMARNRDLPASTRLAAFSKLVDMSDEGEKGQEHQAVAGFAVNIFTSKEAAAQYVNEIPQPDPSLTLPDV